DHALRAGRDLGDHLELGAVVDRRDQHLATGGDRGPLRERLRQIALALALHADHALRRNALRHAEPDEADLRAQLAELVLDALLARRDLGILGVRLDL